MVFSPTSVTPTSARSFPWALKTRRARRARASFNSFSIFVCRCRLLIITVNKFLPFRFALEIRVFNPVVEDAGQDLYESRLDLVQILQGQVGLIKLPQFQPVFNDLVDQGFQPARCRLF